MGFACGSQFAQAGKVAAGDGGGGFHFDADDVAGLVFDDQVHFILVLVAVVREQEPAPDGGGKLGDFRNHEAFQDGAEGLATIAGVCRCQAEQACRQAAVEEVELWRFDEAFELVGGPRLQAVHQEQLLQYANVAAHGFFASMSRLLPMPA